MSNEDKNTDDIRRLLQQKLASKEAAEDGWNVPSGNVWSGLSEELRENKKMMRSHNRSLWYLIGIAALLVAMLLRECSHWREVGQMQQEIRQIKQECEEKQGQSQQRSPGGTDQIGSTAADAMPVSLTDETVAKGYQNPVVLAMPPQLLPSAPRRPTVSAQNPPTVLNQPPPPVFSETPPAAAPAPPVGLAGEATAVPLLLLEQFHSTEKLPAPQLHLPAPSAEKFPLGLVASAHAGLALTGNELVGQKPAIIEAQRPLVAWRTGVGLEGVINRQWSVLTGIEYQASRIETAYRLSVPFTHVNEYQHDDGNFDNHYNHSLPSSLGNYPAQFVLTRASDAEVAEGEVMDLSLTIRQQTRFLSLPLQLRYGLGQHRWQLGARAGIVANHPVAVSAEMPTLVPHHSAIHQRHTSVGAPSRSDLQKWTLDAALGLDLRYQLNARWGLNLATSYQRGLTPVFQDELVKNYLHAWSVGAGVRYWIR